MANHVETTAAERPDANPPLFTIYIHQNEVVRRCTFRVISVTLLSLSNQFVEELNNCTNRQDSASLIHNTIAELLLRHNVSSTTLGLAEQHRHILFNVSNHIYREKNKYPPEFLSKSKLSLVYKYTVSYEESL